MTIHREGTKTILYTALFLAGLNFGLLKLMGCDYCWISTSILVLSVALWLFIISFFRMNSAVYLYGSHFTRYIVENFMIY